MTDKKEDKAPAFKSVDDVLSHLQRTLHVPKGQRNKFGNYNYRSAEDILNAVKKELPVGATLVVRDDMFEIGGRVYVKATATLKYGDSTVDGYAYAREEESKKGMDASQVTGATSSYARKYALNGLLCIDDTQDSDATNTHGKEDKKKEPPKQSDYEPSYSVDEIIENLQKSASSEALNKNWKAMLTDINYYKAVDENGYGRIVAAGGKIREGFATAGVKKEQPAQIDDEIVY